MKTPLFWHACVLIGLGSLGSGLSLAQSTTDCSSIANDRARLKCYDEQAARQKKAAAPVAAAPAAVVPPTTAAVPPASARPAPPARTEAPSSAPGDFGLDESARRKKQATANPDAPKPPEQIVARVKAVVTTPGGQYRVTLEDGQVWEETQHTGSAQPPKAGETVTIKRGMLGSYFLSRSTGLALRVKRID